MADAQPETPLPAVAGEAETPAELVSSKPPIGHPDYEFPKEVHNLLVTAQSGHVALSAMADSKASILMGATFVVFTLTLGEISDHKATASLLLLGGFSFIATIFSVLAIRPALINPPRKIKPGMNMVFFGAFARIPEEEYIEHMIGIMRTEEQVYRTMARDLYQNGRVLQFKKYKYLSYAYSAFLIGLCSTLIAFVLEMAMK